MRRIDVWRVGGVLAALTIAGLVAWRLQSGQAAEPDAPPGRALVTLAPVESAMIEETVDGFGVIAASQAASRTVAAPRVVIVTRVFVAPGQPVAAGAPLIEISDAPSTQLAYQQAASAATFAERDLERLQRLYDAHLAANDQLDAARRALADAKAALAAQSRIGAGGARQTLAAPVAATVSAAPVTAGEHVAADAPLITLVAAKGLVAQLNIEPEFAARLAAGQDAHITASYDPRVTADGRVAIVGRQVDAATRQTTVTIPVAGGDLTLGGAVKGEIVISRHSGLRAPRAAVVYDEAGAHVFVVRAGVAHQVTVRPGAEQGQNIEIAGDLRAGDTVAVVGAYQLQDGWPVRTGTQ